MVSKCNILRALSASIVAMVLLQLLLIFPAAYETEKVFTSESGMFLFVQCESEDEVYFYASNQADITVLEIPDEIDGKEVVGIKNLGIASPSVTKMVAGKNVKQIFGGGMVATSINNNSVSPIVSYELNNELKEIHSSAYFCSKRDLNGKPIGAKILVLPSSLERLHSESIQRDGIEAIVFQSDAKADINAVTFAGSSILDDFPGQNIADYPLSVYFTAGCKNFSPFAFNYVPRDDTHDFGAPETYPPEGLTLYKKSECDGFDKFKDNSHEEYYYGITQGRSAPEIEVKEYTEEWWHGLAEIEEVTMTAEGMSEKTEQVGNGLSDSARKYLSHEYEKSVKSGEKFTVSSAFAPSDAYDDRTFFVSMDETVATVDTETGEVTALKKGTARIRCVAASGVFSDCILKVDGGDNTNGVQHYTEYDYGETTLPKETTTDPDLSANQTKTTDWKEFFFTNKLYIIIPVAAAAILTAAVVVIKKKKR